MCANVTIVIVDMTELSFPRSHEGKVLGCLTIRKSSFAFIFYAKLQMQYFSNHGLSWENSPSTAMLTIIIRTHDTLMCSVHKRAQTKFLFMWTETPREKERERERGKYHTNTSSEKIWCKLIIVNLYARNIRLIRTFLCFCISVVSCWHCCCCSFKFE